MWTLVNRKALIKKEEYFFDLFIFYKRLRFLI